MYYILDFIIVEELKKSKTVVRPISLLMWYKEIFCCSIYSDSFPFFTLSATLVKPLDTFLHHTISKKLQFLSRQYIVIEK